MAFVKSTSVIEDELIGSLGRHAEALRAIKSRMEDGEGLEGLVDLVLRLEEEASVTYNLLSDLILTTGALAVRTGHSDLAMGPGVDF